MFFEQFIRRKLLFLLLPWLAEEPELDLEIGFIRSKAVAKNLRLNTSVLNGFVDGAAGLSIKEVVIEHFGISFSSWSAPAFAFEVRGVHLTLSAGECSSQERKSKVSFEEHLKKNLTSIDPEGTTMHAILEKLLETRPRSQLKEALLNHILKFCQIEMHNISIELKFSIIENVFACLLGIKKLKAKCQNLDHGWFLKGLICAPFQPQDSSFDIDGSEIEVTLKRDNQISHILNLRNLLIYLKLDKLELTETNLTIPEINIAVSPIELSIFSALPSLLSRKYIHVRNGRQLWNLAASRLFHLISAPRFSWYHLVRIIRLWLCYVKAYECLLLLTAHSAKHLTKQSTKMSQCKKLSSSLNQYRNVISSNEKELSFVPIALGRKIARNKAVQNDQPPVENEESFDNNHFRFFYKILDFLLSPLKFVLKIVLFILCSFSVSKVVDPELLLDANFKLVHENGCSKSCFSTNVGKVIVTVSPVNELQTPASAKSQSNFDLSYFNLMSFCFSVGTLSVIYVVNICEQALLISCGQTKVTLASTMEGSFSQSSSSRFSRDKYSSEKRKDLKSILWGEPVRSFISYEGSSHSGGVSNPLLRTFLGEALLKWKSVCKTFKDSENKYLDDLFLLCEVKKSLTIPGFMNSNMGASQSNLMLGKLNINLEYSSILFISLLLREVEHAFGWTKGGGRKDLLHCPETKMVDNKSLDCNNESYTSGIMVFLKKLPKKHFQWGMFVAGPLIQLSLKRKHDSVNESQSDVCFTFNFHHIEVAAWPASRSDLTALEGSIDFVELEVSPFEEPQITNISISGKEKYVCQESISICYYLQVNGFDAYLGDSIGEQDNEVLVLNPLLIRASSTGEYAHSLSANAAAFSLTLSGTVMGLSSFLYMDELYVISQAIEHILSTLSELFNEFDSTSWGNVEFLRKETGLIEQVHEITSGKEGSLICGMHHFLLNCTFRMKSMDLIIHISRRTDNIESCMKLFNISSIKKLAEINLPECGIWTSIQQVSLTLSCEDDKINILTDILEVRSVVFQFQKISSCRFASKDLLMSSVNCLYTICLLNLTFKLWVGFPCDASSSGNTGNILGNSMSGDDMAYMDDFYRKNNGRSGSPSTFFDNLELRSAQQFSTSELVINFEISWTSITSMSLYNVLSKVHQPNKFLSSLSVAGILVSWKLQGGFLFIETAAVSIFYYCYDLYLQCMGDLLYVLRSFDKDKEVKSSGLNLETSRLSNHIIDENIPETSHLILQGQKERAKAYLIDMSNFSLVLVIEDGSGNAQEFVIAIDAHGNFQLQDMGRKLMLNLSRLSIFSRAVHRNVDTDIKIPHFSSDLSWQDVSRNPDVESQRKKMVQTVDDASCSHDAIAQNDLMVINCGSGVSHSNNQRYILKCLIAVLSAKKYIDGHLGISQVWSGSISLSGFDMTYSLSELQIILLMVSSFSGEDIKETTNRSGKRQWFNDPEIDLDSRMKAIVPDGAIVAIQDVHEHMYLTVAGDKNKNNLVGTTHYSLVGERALFRVKYSNERRWPSSVLWFSFISLFAKNELGEPLLLNCHPRSGFVDISGTKDQKTTLWRMLSHETESSSSNFDWELHNQLAKRTFYLVNKKNDLAVAFIDGVPEFVRKPGNPFKLKVFDNFSVVSDRQKLDGYPDKVSGFSHRDNAFVHEQEAPEKGGKFPCIDVSFEKISLTVVHEIVDTKDTFPLLCGSISNNQLIIQIMSSKTRVVSTSNVVLHYFDGTTSVWRDLLHPVELNVYYRSNFIFNGAETTSNKFPLHIHCRIKEVEISLSEISLDILLYIIGKLNLAGPFSVRTSTILANCCKVDNRTGLNLLCNCYNKQSLTISRQQSASIFLRQADLSDQHLENKPVVSIQLAALGSFATSPIHLSHLHAQAFAWRTRIISLEDSRTYPGPSVVVDISRNSTDGLSILISPIVRLQNETGFSLELRFQRGSQKEEESATVFLKPGESIDNAMAVFDALNVSGGPKKALTSLSFGNFFFSFRPDLTESFIDPLVEWSEDFKGEKAIRLSGIFNKLSYKLRKTLAHGSEKFSFSTAHCNVKSKNATVNNLHFLIQSIARDVPVLIPDKSKGFENNSSVTLLEQKTIFLLPTVRVINLLYSDIHVLLTVTDASSECDNIGNQATIHSGSAAHFYVDPSVIYFNITLTSLSCVCKPVNSSECVKKLLKQKNDVHHLDIDLDFGGGKYFASLRLSRGHRGILEATIFTSYALKNDTDFPLYFVEANKKNLSRHGAGERFSICPQLGLCLTPHSTSSLFIKSKKVLVKISDDCVLQELLDLGALSGLTEISLESKEQSVVKSILKIGVSTGPPGDTVSVPSQLVTLVPRYVVLNGSDETIFVRQCYLQDDVAGVTQISSKQKTTLQLQNIVSKTREFSLFENFVKTHKKNVDDSLRFIQIGINESTICWSGPVCIASLGCFFLKFRKLCESVPDKYFTEFASVHVQEEGSTLALRFLKPPNMAIPYRVENCLNGVSVTFYQKDFLEAEVLGSRCTVDYVWDDLNLPHKLVIRINDSLLLREISLDKLRSWKPFYKPRKQRNFAFQIPKEQRNVLGDFNSVDMIKVGYEVYADGPTRVLRICESCDRHWGHLSSLSSAKIQLRVSRFTVHLLEHGRQSLKDNDDDMLSIYTPIIAARLGCINLDSLFTAKQKYNQIMVQSLSLEEKWVGAPFAAMLRKHHLDIDDPNGCDLKIVCVLTTSYDVKQVQYLSVVLQPIDLNLDEETLMKIVPFWRTSLNTSNVKSQQYYFDHFEIHPVKIIASFLPGESYSSYSSSQETLRSLLHSVVQIPPIKNTVVELNGVLVTHAMITIRELLLRCARHYSWYAMRAIYMAKGSPLLPPDFVSMFDDLASSSLDVFFDPSRGLMNLPGLTLGTFKLIHKCIDNKGFSGTKRYFGDLGKTLRAAGSNVLFAAVTEISDSIMKGAEASGFDGIVNGFHQGILKIAMEPSVLGTALMEGGPDRKIKLDRSPGVDELYIEGYLQAMLDTMYRQAFLRIRVIDNQVILKNLPPNSTLIDEIMERVKDFLVSKALLKGDPSAATRPLRQLRGDTDWKIGPTVLTLCEHLFVSFAIRILRKQVNKLLPNTRLNKKKVESDAENEKLGLNSNGDEQKGKFIWKWGLGKFVLSGVLAYIDGRLCRGIPNPIARRIVSGFLLTFLDNNNTRE